MVHPAVPSGKSSHSPSNDENSYIQFQRYDQDLTEENASFIKEVVQDKYGPLGQTNGLNRYLQPQLVSPLKTEATPRGDWFPGCRRSGVIAVKIGVYPQWTKDGSKFTTTLLQVLKSRLPVN